jgi:hypothetical protein
MSLCGKGHWARFNIDTTCADKWLEIIRNKRNLFAISAFAAQAAVVVNENISSAVGINPPDNPRADAQESFQRQELETTIFPAAIATLADPENKEPWILSVEINEGAGVEELNLEDDLRFGAASDFDLDGKENKWGFWFVTFERTELEDVNSMREALSAELFKKPFKSLPAADRKEINNEISGKSVTYVKRVQVPVFLDFAAGHVWVGTTSKGMLEQIMVFFEHAIGHLQPMVLSFPAENAIEQAIAEITEKDLYANEHAEFLEKLEKGEEAELDKDMHNIAVASFDSALVTMQAPAMFVPRNGKGEVKAKEFADALTICATASQTLKLIGGTFVFEPIPATKSKVSVEIVAGFKALTHIYRSLEPSVQDADLEEEYYANPATSPRSMYAAWLNWLGALRWSEKRIVAGLAAALTLDPSSTNVGILPLLESPEEETINT